MKRLLAAFLSLVAFVASAQNKGIFQRWVPIPSAPTLTSPTTITPGDFCCGGAIFTPPGGSTAGGDIILNGNFNGSPGGASLRQWDGDPTHIWRIVNAAGTILGTAGGTAPGVSVTDHGSYLYFYGLSPAEPMVVKGERGMGGFTATTAGSVHVFQNVVAKSPTAAAWQANGTTASGSFYKYWEQTFCRSILSGQEGILYGGRTSWTPTQGALHKHIKIKHSFAYSPFRDGWQIEPCDYFEVDNVTVKDAGQRNSIDGSDQKNNFQIEGTHGHARYGIYDHGVNLFTIFSNGDTIAYNYISADLPGYIGKSSDLTLYFNSAGLNSHIDGSPIIIENNNIKNTGVFTYAMEIKEEVADVIIRNNNFQGYTTTYLDSRACLPSCSNTICCTMGSNGNASLTIPVPAYVIGYDDPDDYEHQGLSYHYKIGSVVIGYREKSPGN